MKMSAKVIEVENEGFISYLNRRITVYCMNYIYTGNLVGVNDTCLKLSDGGVVFNTGAFNTSTWEDYQALPYDFYVQISAIEAFMELK